MVRQPCCDKVGLKRGPWTVDEDQKLLNFILNNGIHCWRLVPKLAGLMRCGKSCRLRWTNYLRPDLKRGALSEAEEDQIIQLHCRLGNRWSKIASHFPGRTDNEIKNHWNTGIRKRLKLLGVDPITHKPNTIDQDVSKSKAEENSIAEEDAVLQTMEEEKQNVDSRGNIDDEGIINSQANTSSTSSSTSFSLEDNMIYTSSVEEWKVSGADSFDSFSSWEALCQLEDLLYFGINP